MMTTSDAGPDQIRLATASPATAATTKQTLTELEQLAARAGRGGADILLLPEAYLGGYPRGSGFGCVIGQRTDEGREEYRRYFRGCVDFGDVVGENGCGGGARWVGRMLGEDGDGEEDGGIVVSGGGGGDGTDMNGDDDGDHHHGIPQMSGRIGGKMRRGDGTREELERIARNTGVFLVVGCVERCGGSLYCAVAYVCPRRGCVGKRRKVMPTGSERLVWAQGGAGTLRAVSAVFGPTTTTTTTSSSSSAAAAAAENDGGGRGGGGGGGPRRKNPVRVNMAAAICWESYMPLLRQALYAQNVNLYLAPTADGRDAWMALMRTVALEGRCFVASANQCVRASDSGANAVHTAAAAAGPGGAATTGQKKQRRNSCMTEDGFEIALPPHSTNGSQQQQQQQQRRSSRRKSIFDEDGNEIVLCEQQQQQQGPMAGSAVVLEEEEEEEEGGVNERKEKAEEKKGSSFISRGGSSIVAPSGDVLAGPQWEDDQGILYADVDFEDCVRGRLDLDAAGSYSRNDSFKFSVEGLNLDPLPYY